MPEIITIAGASGIVGTHLIQALQKRGDQVRILTTSAGAPRPSDIESFVWNPTAAAGGNPAEIQIVATALDGASAIVNLAGASIGEGRMNGRLKDKILDSRVNATRALVNGFKKAEVKPPVWIQASATGYYGDTGEREATESLGPDPDFFLSRVCVQWEAEAAKVLELDGAPRQAVVRIGLVLAADAPAWQKMLLPIKLGAGGPLGDGQQWWAWIDADDLAAAMVFLIDSEHLDGPWNMVAPGPVRQVELTRQAARRLGRPAFLPAPAFALRAVLGEAADALLLPSCKALPEKLKQAGFQFHVPSIEALLNKIL